MCRESREASPGEPDLCCYIGTSCVHPSRWMFVGCRSESAGRSSQQHNNNRPGDSLRRFRPPDWLALCEAWPPFVVWTHKLREHDLRFSLNGMVSSLLGSLGDAEKIERVDHGDAGREHRQHKL